MIRVVNGSIGTLAGATMPELPADVAGVFETLLMRDGRPVFWDEHGARFEAGCHWHGIAAPALARIRDAADQLSAANGIADGVLRYAAWRNGDGLATWCVDLGPPRQHMAKPTLVVRRGNELPAVGPDRGFKHLRRTSWLLQLRQARVDGFDEVMLPDPAGHVVEGAVSNVFLVRRGELWTPPLSLGPLPGILRAKVVTLAANVGVAVREGEFSFEELQRGDELWLTNSLLGIRPVSRAEDAPLPAARPILARMREAWQRAFGWDPVAPLS